MVKNVAKCPPPPQEKKVAKDLQTEEKVPHKEKNVAKRPPHGENVAKKNPYSRKNALFSRGGGRASTLAPPCGRPCRVTNTTIYDFDACLSYFNDLHNILLKNYPG